MKDDFTLDDFRNQFEQLAKLGGARELMASMPGMGDMIHEGEDPDPETATARIKGMIDAMTAEERRNPDLIDLDRLHRIAAGSGTEPYQVKEFLVQFSQVRDLMRKMARMPVWQRIKMIIGLAKPGDLFGKPDDRAY